MVRAFCFVAVSSLLIAPPVFSQDENQDPPPGADRQPAVEDVLKELLSSPADGERRKILVAPDVDADRGVWTCLAQPGARAAQAADACDLGRALSRMEPCTRPEDCRAFDLWTRGLGPPSLEQARPRAEVLRRAITVTRQLSGRAPNGSEDAEDEP